MEIQHILSLDWSTKPTIDPKFGVARIGSVWITFNSLKVFQCCLNLCSFDLCWFVFTGWCLFTLTWPCVPLVYAGLPLFALIELHVLSIHTCSTFVGLLACICGVVLIHACLTLCALSLCPFALVCTCSDSHAVNLSLFDLWSGFVTPLCDTCRTKSHCNDKSYIPVRYRYTVQNKTSQIFNGSH